MSKYGMSIITFIDILDFGQIVEAANNPDQVVSILNALQRASEIDEEYAKLYDKKFVNFSDTVIRATNILSRTNRKRRIGILFHELLDLVYVQPDLIREKILVRGKCHYWPNLCEEKPNLRTCSQSSLSIGTAVGSLSTHYY